MNRTERVDDKNEVICLVIMFTAKVIVIKILKMDLFLNFLLMVAKAQSQFDQNI